MRLRRREGSRNPEEALCEAITAGEQEKIRQIIAEKPEFMDEEGFLHYVVGELGPTASTVSLLLDLGASVSRRDQQEMTPLHAARDVEVMRVLIERGADVNAQDEGGDTPLHEHLASEELVCFLLENGADPNIQNNINQTPDDRAMDEGRYASAWLLGCAEAELHWRIASITVKTAMAFAYANPTLTEKFVEKFQDRSGDASDVAIAACLGAKGDVTPIITALKCASSQYSTLHGIVPKIWHAPLANRREILLGLAGAFPDRTSDILTALSGLLKEGGVEELIQAMADVISLFPEKALELLKSFVHDLGKVKEAGYWPTLKLQTLVVDKLHHLFNLQPEPEAAAEAPTSPE